MFFPDLFPSWVPFWAYVVLVIVALCIIVWGLVWLIDIYKWGKSCLLLTLLLVPTIANAQITNHTFCFSFSDPGYLRDGFGVMQRGPGESQYTEIMRLPADVTQFSVDVVGLPNDEFCYAVFAFNAFGNGGLGSPTCVRIPIPPPTVPAMPTEARILSVSNTSISIGWRDNSNNETAFRIYRKAWNSSSYTFLTTRPANAVSFTNTNLKRKKTYCYQVAAVNAAGESTRTFPVCGTTK